LLYSTPVKWVAVAVLLVIAILAAIAAIEWFTVPIHSLPSFMGKKQIYGHYQKRGAAAALVAFIAVVGAIVLTVRFLRKPVRLGPNEALIIGAEGFVPGSAIAQATAAERYLLETVLRRPVVVKAMKSAAPRRVSDEAKKIAS